MSDDLEEPPRGYTTADVRAQEKSRAKPKRRSRVGVFLLALVAIPAIVLVLWTWAALNYTYSAGERAGFLQKFSRKGWVCKSWEGELALSSAPGVAPEIFRFSARNVAVAARLTENIGRRVAITYAQHKGVPTSCFAETEYFATDVRLAQQ